MQSVPDQSVKSKMSSVLSRNPGLKALSAVAEFKNINTIPEWTSLSPVEIASFTFAPVVSTDVERSFSVCKSVLRDNRRSFLFENLKFHLIVQCNTNVRNVNVQSSSAGEASTLKNS